MYSSKFLLKNSSSILHGVSLTELVRLLGIVTARVGRRVREGQDYGGRRQEMHRWRRGEYEEIVGNEDVEMEEEEEDGKNEVDKKQPGAESPFDVVGVSA